MANEHVGEEKRRLQLEFSAEAYAHLAEMKAKYDAPSFAALIRDALRLYDWVKTQQADGYELALYNTKSEEVEKVKLLF